MHRPGLLLDDSRELAELVAPLFARAEPRRLALAYIDGLLNAAELGNSRRLAEHAGNRTAWSTQRLLTRARWDAEAFRDRVRDYLGGRLARPSAKLVLCQHENLRTGSQAVAVARQPGGRDQQLRNSQLGVLLCYVSAHGSAIVDRELYLPPEWADDPARCAAAGIPEEQSRFRPKTALAREMTERAAAGGMPFSWVVGGAEFSQDGHLRGWLRRRRLPYALELPEEAGRAALASARMVDQTGLHVLNCPRLNGNWQIVCRDRTLLRSTWGPPADGFRHTLLLHRGLDGEETVHLVHAPDPTPLPSMVDAVLARRTADLTVRRAASHAGLGSHQVRGWVAWYRHTTLAMAAAAVRETRPAAGAGAGAGAGPESSLTTADTAKYRSLR
ncbi:IS701 family transposase [Kitasatospora sp. McL0602]|uniref:IS701 family transposase n=1 Tax=Kitasatospora sp. McL0602 TaxID=3439530 RepID=UPI003F8AD2A0